MSFAKKVKQKQKNKTSCFSAECRKKSRINKVKWQSLFNKSIGILIFVLIAVYIASINDLAINGFILNDLKGKAVELENVNERYELLAMTSESYEYINDKAREMGMVLVDDIEYLALPASVVAKK